MDRDETLKLFHRSGFSMLFQDTFHTLVDCDRVKAVIIGAVHNGPLDQGWTPEMFGDPGLFSLGLRTLRTLFPHAEITVAINRRNRKRFDALTIGDLAAVRVLSDRYPQELPQLLVRDIAGERADAGSVLAISFEDALQAGECLGRGRPLTDRILLVAGPGASRPGWYRVPLGTRFAAVRRHLLKAEEHGPWRIIRGNLFSGKAVVSDDEAVSWSDREIAVIREHAVRDLYRFLNPGFDYDSYSRVTVSSFLPLLKRRLDSNVHGGVRPCVQCSFCDEVCPAGLYPHLIWKHVNAGMLEESYRFRPERCIGCGLCDYVCPSKIDICAAVQTAGSSCREGRSA
ncbi:MAG: 4Fe-4S dicluster domain-containing protein [Candidatus Latescibacterota bacterium]